MTKSKDIGSMKSNGCLLGKYWKGTKQLPHCLGLGLGPFVWRGNLSATKKYSGSYVITHMLYRNQLLTIWSILSFHRKI